MIRDTETADRIIDATMTLAAERGWNRVGLSDIAAETGLSLADIRSEFPCKDSILAGFVGRVDREVLKPSDAAMPGETDHDRLFDVLMRRFDALGPYKEALRAIGRDLRREPLTALCLVPYGLNSMRWMLEAAGLSSSGWKGRLRAKALGVVWLRAAATWMDDDSEDLGPTMATLDKALRQAERAADLCPWERRRYDGAPPTPARDVPA